MRRRTLPVLRLAFLLFLLLLSLVAAPARGSDGVIEISQSAALAGNVTPFDAPGFPVTLYSSGSYRLTSNLETGSAAVSAIRVASNDVSIDLNGFVIACSFQARNIPPECTNPGSGNGIDIETGVTRVRVRNGFVRGMGGTGVLLGDLASVENVHATHNGFRGIEVGSGCSITDNTISENGGEGIRVVDDSTVRGNRARSNGDPLSNASGIRAGNGNAIVGNTIGGNDGPGILALRGNTIRANSVRGNSQDGIRVSSGNVISGNSVLENAAGIAASNGGNTLVGNAVHFNTGAGLDLATNVSGTSGYVDNVLAGNNGGGTNDPQVTGGVPLGANVCSTNTTCP